MKSFGLIGYPLGHSFSRTFFKEKFQKEGLLDYSYENFEIKSEEIPVLLKRKTLLGLNVTIPYKSEVLKFVDETDEAVKEIGAANTLAMQNGLWKAFNTDVIGFESSIPEFVKKNRPNTLIFGNGGAAKAVKFVLNKLKIPFKVVSRNNRGDLNYEQLTTSLIGKYHFLVNATPLGMLPNINSLPNIPYDGIHSQHFCYDLVYNPEVTAFLKQCELAGARTKNGLEMLHLQAEASWSIWAKT